MLVAKRRSRRRRHVKAEVVSGVVDGMWVGAQVSEGDAVVYTSPLFGTNRRRRSEALLMQAKVQFSRQRAVVAPPPVTASGPGSGAVLALRLGAAASHRNVLGGGAASASSLPPA